MFSCSPIRQILFVSSSSISEFKKEVQPLGSCVWANFLARVSQEVARHAGNRIMGQRGNCFRIKKWAQLQALNLSMNACMAKYLPLTIIVR